MGLADLAFVLWDEFLRFDPRDPGWVARDRFVLSCGHASMLQYSLLHLFGYDVSLQDIKEFRQWGSNTPGHPEVGHTPGVEVTTGPLGQGVANSVGMALAAKLLAARVETADSDFQPMSQRVFAICSDGDIMEGISSEAASMAGHWRLDNLVWLYDDNRITIDGSTDLAFSEDVALRFQSAGWHVQKADGHNSDQVRDALKSATEETGRPSMIICRTHIGLGSPNKVDTSGAHGAPLGPDELALTRNALNWPEGRFHISDGVKAWRTETVQRKQQERADWDEHFNAWRDKNPAEAALFDRLWSGDVPPDFWKEILQMAPKTGATRKISAAILSDVIEKIPGLVGGSADLSGSNGVALKHLGTVGSPDLPNQDFSFKGQQIYYGIREHAMAAVTNGILLHGGLKPFSATFLVFSDYMRPAIRLAALSNLPNIFIYSHDSIFLGEDGPTHQSVEHHWALRIIPNLDYFRPADGVEVAMTWAYALKSQKTPIAFSLTRQGVPGIEREADFNPEDVWRGGYGIRNATDPHLILVGTGSELHLCTEAGEALSEDGYRVRVVSMPCLEQFTRQDAAYREALIPSGHTAVVTVEAGITAPWQSITGLQGLNIGVDRFGASAPAEVLADKFGLTTEKVTASIRSYLDERNIQP
jgi:transketolase